jgi:GAF domain-containing protein
LKDMEHAKLRRFFDEPHPDSGKLYQSCLVVPITKLSDDQRMAGTLCIDNAEKYVFNGEYDLRIMKELANYAAIVIGSYELATDAIQRLRPRSEERAAL